MKRKFFGTIMLLALSFSLVACGASSDIMTNSSFDAMSKGESYAPSVDDYYSEEAIDGSYETGNTENSNESVTGEKLVYRCNMDIETLNYSETISTIKSSINKYKGIIESESEWDDAHNWYYEDYVKTYGTKNMEITVRIPTKDYENFLSSLDGSGKITSKTSTVENITKRYYETDTYIKSLEKQQERLLEMMDAAVTIEDMITIEARLTEVQYQLNNAKNQLATMDNDVEYSTITLQISEVLEYSRDEEGKKTNTFFDRLGNTIEESFESFFEILEFLLFAIIRLIPIAVIFVPIVLGIRKLLSKNKAKKIAKKAEQNKESK